eukprot:6716623-Pyramimonas_sp.AAC.1
MPVLPHQFLHMLLMLPLAPPLSPAVLGSDFKCCSPPQPPSGSRAEILIECPWQIKQHLAI